MRTPNISDAQVAFYFKSDPNHAPLTAYSINVEQWRDPLGRKDLRTLSGTDEKVKVFLREDSRWEALVATVSNLVEDIVGKQKAAYFSISLHDKKGKWISQGLCESLADIVSERGYKVHVRDATHS